MAVLRPFSSPCHKFSLVDSSSPHGPLLVRLGLLQVKKKQRFSQSVEIIAAIVGHCGAYEMQLSSSIMRTFPEYITENVKRAFHCLYDSVEFLQNTRLFNVHCTHTLSNPLRSRIESPLSVPDTGFRVLCSHNSQ